MGEGLGQEMMLVRGTAGAVVRADLVVVIVQAARGVMVSFQILVMLMPVVTLLDALELGAEERPVYINFLVILT